ncbi:hypothetical protein [Janthinobacterium sp. RA13]|uniref:hypothetical protein n=1 Tax=Janthinobacterium sp. RA13 TaxID=1502762 RepID=UPI001F2E8E8A|nr:hypothetical protein [Janthinobacterium sp. RA13]
MIGQQRRRGGSHFGKTHFTEGPDGKLAHDRLRVEQGQQQRGQRGFLPFIGSLGILSLLLGGLSQSGGDGGPMRLQFHHRSRQPAIQRTPS